MPTISIWDLFFVKNAFYGFRYFKYAATFDLKKIIFFLQILYHFAQNKNLFNDPPIEIFIISMKQ